MCRQAISIEELSRHYERNKAAAGPSPSYVTLGDRSVTLGNDTAAAKAAKRRSRQLRDKQRKHASEKAAAVRRVREWEAAQRLTSRPVPSATCDLGDGPNKEVRPEKDKEFKLTIKDEAAIVRQRLANSQQVVSEDELGGGADPQRAAFRSIRSAMAGKQKKPKPP